MKTSKREFNKKLIFLVCSAVYFGLVLILTSFISHAASDEYYFPMEQNKNNHFSGATSAIDNYFDSANNYIFVSYVTSNWGAATDSFVICYYPKSLGVSLYGEIYSNAREFGLYKTTQSDFSFASFDVYWQNGTIPIVQTVRTITPENFFNRIFVSSSYSSNADYVSNYQIYTSNNVGSRQVVLLYSSSDNDVIEDNNTIPEDFSKPDINNYISNWSNIPTFDNSSVEAALNSVFDSITWFANNINNSLSGLFSYLVDSFNWGLQMVINNIRQVLKNVSTELQEVISDFSDIVSGFLSDIQDLVSDLKDKLSDFYDGFMDFADLFIHPFDEEEFEEQIAECQLITQYDELLDNCDIIREVFETAQEKDSFILYIDFENPFADSEHKIITSEINFNWLVPLRSVYRPFLWVFALLDCFIGGCQLLGSIIGGKAK